MELDFTNFKNSMKVLVLCNNKENNIIKFLEQKMEVDQITTKLQNEDIGNYD